MSRPGLTSPLRLPESPCEALHGMMHSDVRVGIMIGLVRLKGPDNESAVVHDPNMRAVRRGRPGTHHAEEFPQLRKRYWKNGSGPGVVSGAFPEIPWTIPSCSTWNYIPDAMLSASTGNAPLDDEQADPTSRRIPHVGLLQPLCFSRCRSCHVE